MTGLDLENDALIEVAALVTDSELNILGDGVDVVIKPDAAALAQMNDFVRDMHTTSKLLDELPHGITMAEAEAKVLAYIAKHVPDPNKAPLAGNSVGTDRMFLARDMPSIVEHLHYRVIDVSTIKELSRRWYARAYFQSPAKHGGHRALGRHPGLDQRAQVLPRGRLCPRSGPRFGHRKRDCKEVLGCAKPLESALRAAFRSRPPKRSGP